MWELLKNFGLQLVNGLGGGLGFAQNVGQRFFGGLGLGLGFLQKALGFGVNSLKLVGDLGFMLVNAVGWLAGVPLAVYGFSQFLLLFQNNALAFILVKLPLQFFGGIFSKMAVAALGAYCAPVLAILPYAIVGLAAYVVLNNIYQIVTEQGIFNIGRNPAFVKYDPKDTMRMAVGFFLPMAVFAVGCAMGGLAAAPIAIPILGLMAPPVFYAVAVSLVCNALPYGINDFAVDVVQFARRWLPENMLPAWCKAAEHDKPAHQLEPDLEEEPEEVPTQVQNPVPTRVQNPVPTNLQNQGDNPGTRNRMRL